MAFPFAPKPRPFTATNLIERIRTIFRGFPDGRRGGNHQRYTLEDAAQSAFAIFFTQSPSFLDYQRRMQRRLGRNNAQSLFGVHQIPSDNQELPPKHWVPILVVDDTVERRRGKRIRAKGCYRDPVRSTAKHVVECFGLKSCRVRSTHHCRASRAPGHWCVGCTLLRRFLAKVIPES